MTKNNDSEMNLPPPSEHLAHPKYREDIDGLRAIAVLSVVISHAFPKGWLPGGFVGVDIFFVISGYLISMIIFGSFLRAEFSFSEFYSRRIRRIFPALITVLASCFIFAWPVLLADELQQFGKHMAAGAGFISNLILWSESGYFDVSTETKLLLHLWSLGIEEQFYIIWPLILWIAWKQKLNFLAIAIALMALSFLLNILHFRVDSVADFYSPQTRFWELLIGALLAYIMLNSKKYPVAIRIMTGFEREIFIDIKPFIKIQVPVADVLSALGGLLILMALLLISRENFFPGFWALLPVFGAAMVIAAGKDAWFNRTILANRFMVWIGLISYPLYLWHWPLLVYARIIANDNPGRTIRLMVIALSILFAWVTYKYIERPIRFGKNSTANTRILVLVMFGLGCLGYITYANNGFEFRLNQYQLRKIHPLGTQMQIDDYQQHELSKIFWNGAATDSKRDFFLLKENPGQKIQLAVLGDSHANRLYLAVKEKVANSIMNVGRGTCPPFFNVDVIDKKSGSLHCQPLTNNYLNYVKNDNDIKAVIINAFYGKYNRDVTLLSNGKATNLTDSLAETIRLLVDSGKAVILALDVPEVPRECYGKKIKRHIPVWNSENGKNCFIKKTEYINSGNQIRQLAAAFSNKTDKVFIYDPSDVFCNKTVCGEIDPRNYFYHSDGQHLNEFGMKILGDKLSWQLEQVLGSMNGKK